jgi:hypothetical protein
MAHLNQWTGSRAAAFLASSLLLVPILAGCFGGGAAGNAPNAKLPPIDESMGGRGTQAQAPKQGMSMGQKAVMLAGAAALYYMYKKNQEKHKAGTATKADPQYYLSKNGRVYYRDGKGQVHWVTPPTGGIQVSAQEAGEYSKFEGYNGQRQGMTLEQYARQAGVR